MKELKIVFTKSKKKFPIASWLIRAWTGKKYSHVARAANIQEWGWRYFQANEGKVNYEYEEHFLKKHEIIKEYTIIVDTEMDKKIKETCYKQCGNKYGIMQNIGIFLIDLGILKSNPWKSGVNCSELIYTHVLKPMFPELDHNPDTIKPHEIENILISKGYKNER